MIEPDDFGLSDVRTFAHIGDPAPGPEHSVFWKRWFSRLAEHTPVLTARKAPDASDPSATHELVSHGGVRIGCSLLLPDRGRPVGASLVVVHGYTVNESLEDSAARWRAVADNGVAVLVIRLRGYRGSRIGIGDQTRPDGHGCGWIGRGLLSDDAGDWIVPHAVADVCNACRVMRNALRDPDTSAGSGVRLRVDDSIEQPGVFLHGVSLGGGLAAIAAAQLIGKISGDPIVDRLGLAVPSLGDWRWRLDHAHGGITAEVVRLLDHAGPDHRAGLVDRLRLCDAVVHGRRVRIPTLGMLARRDDVVPAPSAAAVFNSIDADPGRKWRFVVPYGHWEGGIANARRHALFGRAAADFFDPARTPIEAMIPWELTLHDGVLAPDGQTATPTGDQSTELK